MPQELTRAATDRMDGARSVDAQQVVAIVGHRPLT
jgi:hypothetical protein